MKPDPIGISDLALFMPKSTIDLQTIVDKRIADDPNLEKHLARALKSTGQIALRFPRVWEDTITLAAEAAKTLLEQNPKVDRAQVRFLTLGTETSVDMSKAGSSYVLGMLAKAGLSLPSTLSTWQVQHACAGGALSMMTVAGFLQAGGRAGETGIVLTSDIARYAAPSTAEVTQGAGATAILVGKNPDLIELDLETAGFHSADVDDFFRPLGSTIAKVKGGFSVQCYNEALIGAFEDHCRRAGVEPAAELEATDIFVLHVPYSAMPLSAMEKLLAKHLGLETEAAHAWLAKRGFFASLEPSRVIGNIYTGSMFLGLAFSLKERLAVLGSDLVGKKILLASYGSGNTMAVLPGRLAAKAPEVIGRWQLEAVDQGKQPAAFADYQAWLDTVRTPENYPELVENSAIPEGVFYLRNMREDGYREYDWK